MTDGMIQFSPPMVRALIAGRKTQTRRVLKPTTKQVKAWAPNLSVCRSAQASGGVVQFEHPEGGPYTCVPLPWRVGDRLWVRELWRTFVSLDDVAPRDLLTSERGAGIAYEAGGGMSRPKLPLRVCYTDYALDQARAPVGAWGRLRAAMHLPRWGSRITVVVTDVRVQRLQEISEADCDAEGISQSPLGYGIARAKIEGKMHYGLSAYGLYRDLWNSLHGPDAWAKNPFVAAISFRVILANIDAPEAKAA